MKHMPQVGARSCPPPYPHRVLRFILQLNLHAYSKIVTRRIADVIPMQVDLLLVTAVCEDAVSSKGGLVVQLLAWLDSSSDDKLKELMAVDPKVEKRRRDLENDVARLKQIQEILDRSAPAPT